MYGVIKCFSFILLQVVDQSSQPHLLKMHWEDSEGSGGEGGGRGDQDGEHMYIHGWFMLMYDKNHYNIVK